MAGQEASWQAGLERWLEPFLARLTHPARRAMCPLYLAGLIGPGDRKSVQPMARRLGLGGHDQLHHFVGGSAVGIPPRSRPSSWPRPTVWSAGFVLASSSTTPLSRR